MDRPKLMPLHPSTKAVRDLTSVIGSLAGIACASVVYEDECDADFAHLQAARAKSTAAACSSFVLQPKLEPKLEGFASSCGVERYISISISISMYLYRYICQPGI